MEKIINQIDKTGFGQGTEKIKETTNQGKKLSAYEALIMRDKNVNLADQIDRTSIEESKRDPGKPDTETGKIRDSQFNMFQEIIQKNKK